jgi:alpha 1,3-glucosidase
VVVEHAPFALSLHLGASPPGPASPPAISFNGGGFLDVQPLRLGGPAENETWAESWKGNTDARPAGPQAVAFDLGFPSGATLYGLPERAAPAALRPTAGPDPANASAVLEAEPYRLYNLDVFEYEADSNFGLYGSIPVVIAHSPGGESGPAGDGGKKSGSKSAVPAAPTTVGALWLNAAEMWVDLLRPAGAAGPADTRWIAEAGVIDLWLFPGPTPSDVARQLARVSGPTALPQLFSLGYHQCRWNYKDEADVRGVDAGFDAHDMPYDVIWLDIEHTDGKRERQMERGTRARKEVHVSSSSSFSISPTPHLISHLTSHFAFLPPFSPGKRYFTWDKTYFPNPKALFDDIASRGRKAVAIVDPHIKKDAEWDLYKGAAKAGHFVKAKDGSDFEGWCWPGSSAYLDVTSSPVRDWWAGRFALDTYAGSTPDLHIWNDMNEPSVFNGPEVTMPKDALHAGGWEHRALHNQYGFWYHAATAQGLAARGRKAAGSDGDRPFVLSRAFFAGTQTVGPVWTGDNSADWAHLRASVPMLLTLGLAGLPFSGADVGGFFGDPPPDLLVRWYQAAALQPFFRGHAHLDAPRREPWLAGDPHAGAIREALRARYRLLPYLYTLFRAANATGAPIMRPLWWEFPADAVAPPLDDQFMVGPAILSAPVLTPAPEDQASKPVQDRTTTRRVYLPPTAAWYDASSGALVSTPGKVGGWADVQARYVDVPTFYRGGHVLAVRERARRSTAAAAKDPLTLIVALDPGGKACGDLYLDDGTSFAFTRGVYAARRICFEMDVGRGRAGDADLGLGVLTSTAAPALAPSDAAVASVPPGGRFTSDVVIGRVVILGHPSAAAGHQTAKPMHATRTDAAGAGGEAPPVDVAPGPLTLRDGAPPAVGLVVRKPDLPAAGDWSLAIRPGKASVAAAGGGSKKTATA